MKKIKTQYILIGVVSLIVGLFAVGGISQSSDPSIVSKRGLHWHPKIEIFVKGEKVEIPESIGVGPQYAGLPTYDAGMRMTAMHTHDDTPIIHLEFQGVVRESSLALGNFFQIWGRDMRGLGSNMRMKVNGIESTQYEQYIMRDGDVIELHYD